jgi:hypothetical protein
MSYIENKVYTTKDGRPARVICENRANDRPVVALVKYTSDQEDIVEYYHTLQRYQNTSDPLDLVELVEWAYFDIDTPVWAWYLDRTDDPVAGHYAGIHETGRPMIFCGGCTSHSVCALSNTQSFDRVSKSKP